jgi:hypothetical protein
MAITTSTGILDTSLGYIVAGSDSTWAATSSTTWENLLTWNPTPANPLIWAAAPLDLGVVGTFNVNVSTVYQGDLQKYEIWTSTTGAFAGEETLYTINEGDENVTAFYGRYVLVAAWVYQAGAPTALIEMIITASQQAIDLSIPDVDSSTLPTFVSVVSTATVPQARVLDIGRRVSAVVDAHFTPRYISTASGGYSVPGDQFEYFEQFNFGAVTLPAVVQKRLVTTSTQIASGCATVFILQNQNGDIIDNTVDARIRCLPEQFMQNGQLLTR